jgi:hypothetical protein
MLANWEQPRIDAMFLYPAWRQMRLPFEASPFEA